jgi:hypothetical protein
MRYRSTETRPASHFQPNGLLSPSRGGRRHFIHGPRGRIGPIALIFGLLNFSENKIPLLLSVAGLVMYFMGAGAMAEQAMSMPQ